MGPGWYAIVMGLTGLALAWLAAADRLGSAATTVAAVVAVLAALVFALLAVFTVWRGLRHREAWREDRRHPVRHAFVATLPVSLLLLATAAVALHGPALPARALWWAGSLSLLGVTVWVLARWWPAAVGAAGAAAGVAAPAAASWAGVTPALLIPVVGNVLAPLAGVPLGHADWAAAQFGIGLVFWPVVMALLLARIVAHGMFAERLLPTAFIVVAPPAVSALALLALGAPRPVAWALWGAALLSLLWALTTAPRLRALPFALPHWALSFPLAAFTALTLKLAGPAGVLATAAIALLALTTLVIVALALATLRGLRNGSLLVPEPLPLPVPVRPA
jgi:tellurite resistance protein